MLVLEERGTTLYIHRAFLLRFFLSLVRMGATQTVSFLQEAVFHRCSFVWSILIEAEPFEYLTLEAISLSWSILLFEILNRSLDALLLLFFLKLLGEGSSFFHSTA